MKTLIILLTLSVIVQASQLDNLNNDISSITAETASLQADIPTAIKRLKDETNLSESVLMVGTIMQAAPGDTILWPVSLVPGSFLPTALQADIVIPGNFSFVSIIPGPAAVAAGKQITSSSVNGNRRFVLFGLNDTVIGSGEIAILQLKISTGTLKGQYPVAMIGPVVSDASGNAITSSVVSGTVEVQ